MLKLAVIVRLEHLEKNTLDVYIQPERVLYTVVGRVLTTKEKEEFQRKL